MPDLTSPEVECVTKGVTDRFDNWFESKNQLNIERYFCVCDISSNACITRYNITSCAQENYGNPLYCKGLFEGDEVPSCDCNKCSCESSNDGMLRPSCTEKVCIDKSECEALEGFWVDSNNSWVIIDEPYCNLPFSDHGKECTDSSQCEGNCEPPQEYLAREPGEDGWNVWVTPYRENVTGNCSKFSTGCLSYQIINGTLDLESQSICVVN